MRKVRKQRPDEIQVVGEHWLVDRSANDITVYRQGKHAFSTTVGRVNDLIEVLTEAKNEPERT
jgi:hypothetical protein